MIDQIVQKIRAHRIPIAHPLPQGGFKLSEVEAIGIIDSYVEEIAVQARDASDRAVALQLENTTLRLQLATLIEQSKQPGKIITYNPDAPVGSETEKS